MKRLMAIALLVAATSSHASIIGLLISYEYIVTDRGVPAWKCTYNLNEHNSGADRRTIISSIMCPAEMLFD